MSDFDIFKNAVTEGAKVLGKELLGNIGSSLENDIQEFLEECKDDLKENAIMLSNGELTRDEFEALLRNKEALAKLRAITQAGITLTKIENFRKKLIDLVINKAFEILL